MRSTVEDSHCRSCDTTQILIARTAPGFALQNDASVLLLPTENREKNVSCDARISAQKHFVNIIHISSCVLDVGLPLSCYCNFLPLFISQAYDLHRRMVNM